MAEYTILARKQITQPSLVGGLEQAWRITYQLPDKTTGTVTVPDGPTMAQDANAAICAQIAQFDELHKLGQ